MTLNVQKIVILGGGTAGWMTAAALSRFLISTHFQITLVESEQIGTVGVGEATIPHIREFNFMLGINEFEFMQAVRATFKLGIRFKGWGSAKSDYFHPFGTQGYEIENIAFHHYWLKVRSNENLPSFDDFSFAVLAAKKDKFAPPSLDKNSVTSHYSYAYHLDASAYAMFLRHYAEAKGVKRVEGKVSSIEQNKFNGDITCLKLENDTTISGDLFIDCSGFASLLLGENLGVPYEDWTPWLPCDSAFAAQSELANAPVPYTISTAQKVGWQWRIPLRERMGNGYVYSSKFITDKDAEKTLTKNIEGRLISEPRKISFKAGMRTQSWIKNCVAIGLSSGFLEPLESTSIYLIQLGIYKLLELLPSGNIEEVERTEFNSEIKLEYERVRDFLILHYKLNNREDSDFWRYCKNMDIPESLEYKLSLFKASGHVVEYGKGLFEQPSWLAVYIGQDLFPDTTHPFLDTSRSNEIYEKLHSIHNLLDEKTSGLTSHNDALKNLKNSPLVQIKPAFNLYGTPR